MSLLVLGVAAFLAYANGANDVSKASATLIGSGVASYRRAILWGAAWAFAGALTASFLGTAMLATFGAGMLAPNVVPTAAAALATMLGAASWVILATRIGMPVSTTHAIVGSLSGVAALAYGIHSVAWTHVAAKIGAPLLLSPVVAFSFAWVALRIVRPSVQEAIDCVCASMPATAVASSSGTLASNALAVTVGTTSSCAVERRGALQLRLDHAHWFTSGATSFARALNDTPKMVALVAACAVGGGTGRAMSVWFAVIAIGIGAGSLLGGLRVSRVLAEKITRVNHREGFVANAVTAALVTVGAGFGLPMSTTHVSSSAIVASGVGRGAAVNRRTLREILLAWVVTLPAAALLGCCAYAVVRRFVSE